MALAVYSQLSDGEGIATISESTSFIKGVHDGVVYAEGRVIRKGRRVAFCEAEVWTHNGQKALLSRTSAAFAVTQEK
jgi:acyl-CoA thioesterase